MLPAVDLSKYQGSWQDRGEAIDMIKMSGGAVTKIDPEDYDKLSQYKWYLHSKGYACRDVGGRKNRKTIFMHDEIMGHVGNDHINHDKLDNRKQNLRPATRSQNQHNLSKFKNNTSGYIGVSKTTWGKWHAYLWNKSKRVHIGYFYTPEEAARARDEMAIKLHGEYANLNFERKSYVVA